MKQAQTTQIYIPLNHWSSLQEVLSAAPSSSFVLVLSYEQQLFIKELAPHLKVVREVSLISPNAVVYLWPFEFLEHSESYYQLCAQGRALCLLSWSWDERQVSAWRKRAELSDSEIHFVETKLWRPMLGHFWFFWSHKRWQEMVSWGREMSVFYKDEKDLRQLKRFYKAQQIPHAKRSFCRLVELHWRVPLNEEEVVFTHEASQTLEYRYFQGFQRCPQKLFYLLQYAQLMREKLLAPFRLI